MPLFVFTGIDKPDSLQLRLDTREAHFRHVQGASVQVRLGGPFLDALGRMAGSLIVLEAADQAAAEAFVAEDPYAKAGLWARSELRPWKATAGDLATAFADAPA